MCHISPDQWVAPLDDVIRGRSLMYLIISTRNTPGFGVCKTVDQLCDKLQKISITQSTIASTGGSDYASCDPFEGGYFTFSSVKFKIV